MSRIKAFKKLFQIFIVGFRGYIRHRISWVKWKFKKQISKSKFLIRIVVRVNIYYMLFWRDVGIETIKRYYRIDRIRSKKLLIESRLEYFKYLQWIGGILSEKTIEYEKADYIAHKIVSLGFIFKSLPTHYRILKAMPEEEGK